MMKEWVEKPLALNDDGVLVAQQGTDEIRWSHIDKVTVHSRVEDGDPTVTAVTIPNGPPPEHGPGAAEIEPPPEPFRATLGG